MTVHAEIRHKSTKIFDLAMDNKNTMLLLCLINNCSEFGADDLYIFGYGCFCNWATRNCIAKTGMFLHAIRDRNVGLQSATTSRAKAFRSFKLSG